MKSQKFKPQVFTRRPGGKHTDHSAGWLADVVSAVKTGTPDAHKRLTIAYHGVPPHVQDDLSAPIAARPSVAPTEPQDVPGADDQVRTLAPGNMPIHPGTKGASAGPKVPATCGASSAAPLPVDPFAKG
jgi:hypothetical protein